MAVMDVTLMYQRRAGQKEGLRNWFIRTLGEQLSHGNDFVMLPSDSRSTCSRLCFISHRAAPRETLLFLCLRRLEEQPDELLHSQTMTSR